MLKAGGNLDLDLGALKRRRLELSTLYVDNLWQALWYFWNSSNYLGFHLLMSLLGSIGKVMEWNFRIVLSCL